MFRCIRAAIHCMHIYVKLGLIPSGVSPRRFVTNQTGFLSTLFGRTTLKFTVKPGVGSHFHELEMSCWLCY